MIEPAPAQTPGLLILQGNRLEDLRELSLSWLARHPLHPLERTVFLVQSNGMAQWLKMSIAEQDGSGRGICLGTDMMLPARFQWQAYRAVINASAGLTQVPESSPFDKQALRWRLLQMLPELTTEAAFSALARYLAGDQELRRHDQLAQRLADLYDQYQVYRADWLADWAAGDDQLRLNGQRRTPVPDTLSWQPLLWRRLLASVPPEQAANHRSAVHTRFLDAVAQLASRPPALPPRVVVFGIATLPRQTLEALAAVATLSQVILCLLNPCRHDWSEIIESREVLRRYHRQQRRPGMPEDLAARPELLHLHTQPLLAAWGRQGRDYLQLLAAYDTPDNALMRGLQEPVDLFSTPETTTLLGQLQDDILELRPPAESRARWPAVNPSRDHSLRFHICHSPQRELEVLHDTLLAEFDADHSLQPRDIIVMVPDIHEYAASIDAVFGQFEKGEPRHLPYHISDRKQRRRAPVLVALETLLRLPELRLRASELLDLLDIAAVRARFGISATDLPTLQRWIDGANIRWGLDARQRSQQGLPLHSEMHSWRFGLKRMLLGYCTGEAQEDSSEDWADVSPYTEVAGLEAALAGRLYRLLLTLEHLGEALSGEQRPADWVQTLGGVLEQGLLATSTEDETLLTRAQSALAQWQQEVEEAGLAMALPLGIVRDSWLAALDEPQLSQSFQLGRITFATLMPMRAIPFRQVYLLGMNDGAYPRRAPVDDFDLMAMREHYRAGDRSRRDDDRYLLLEAVLSAREKLSISWCGRSVQDNREQPPSVLLAQLREHIAGSWRLAGSGNDGNTGVAEPACDHRLLAALDTAHPLQPFARAYFAGDSALFSYAREWCAVHDGAVVASTRATPLADWLPEGGIDTNLLGDFLRDPIGALFQQRLNTSLRRYENTVADEEPFTFDALQRWQQTDALLQPIGQRLAQAPGQDAAALLASRLARRQRAGDFPPEPVGLIRQGELAPRVLQTLQGYSALLDRFSDAVQSGTALRRNLDLRLPSGSTAVLALEHSSEGLRRRAAAQQGEAGEPEIARIVLLSSTLLRTQGGYTSLKWSQILRQWPAHLALQCCHERACTYLVSPGGTLELLPIPARQAGEALEQLTQAWLDGMHRPAQTDPELAMTLLERHPVDEPGDWPPAEALQDVELLKRLEKRFRELRERQPLVGRDFPTLDSLLQAPGFGPDSLQLYGDFARQLASWPGLQS